MKKILCLAIILFSGWVSNVQGQPRNSDEKVILEFLTYIAGKDWSKRSGETMKYFDTVTDKHLIFYKNDTTNRQFRINYLLGEIQRLSKQIQQIRKSDLRIVPYDKAPDSLQIIKLSPSYRERSYVAFNNKGFKRYFLMEEGKIDAFVLWGKTAFAKLN